MKNCLLCGVGGQGTVLASRIIACAAMEKGLFARTAETIGMSQRGGSVVSHVRVGEAVPSPLIPFGNADVLLGFEPGETVRNLSYLKPGGTVIVSDQAVQAVTAAVSGKAYHAEQMLEYLRTHTQRCYVLPAQEICEACGSAKVMNVALLGAMAASGVMALSLDEIGSALVQRVKPQYVEMNQKALQLGAQCV